MRHLTLWLLVAFAAVATAACASGDGEEEFPRVVTLGSGEVFPVILNDSLAVGENRLVMSINDQDDNLVRDATVSLRFFDLNGEDPELTHETEARFVPIELSYVDEQAPQPEPSEAGASGVYVANVSFHRAGEWGLKAVVTADGQEVAEAPFRFNVLQDTSEPGIGDEAPPSVQPTLATVAAVEEIDSSYPPRPHMHDLTIADALAAGRPFVVAFATPAYCRTRTCAPIMDTVMDPLYERYAGRAAFIHVEPYVLRDLRAGFVQNPVPATREWGIQSEPWLFLVGSDGRIAAKFQGAASLEEVEAALQAALG